MAAKNHRDDKAALRCMVCGHGELRSLYEVTDTNQGTVGVWEIVACDECRLGVLHPFPPPERVGEFYRDQFYTEGGQRFRGWMEWLRSQFALLRGQTLNRLRPEKGWLLDFGSGSGHFAAAQSRQGWNVVALDPYSKAVNSNAAFELVDDWVRLNYPDASFEVVTLWYVVEHLSNPRAMIKEFFRVLKPGGLLVLAQQDFDSLQARVFGPRWLFLDPPRHLWQFSVRNLTALVEHEGFNVCELERASLEMGPFTILQSMLNCVVGNGNYLFKLLKSKNVGGASKGSLWATTFSLILLPIFGPLSLLIYFVLLSMKSSDVFTLYCQRRSPNKSPF